MPIGREALVLARSTMPRAALVPDCDYDLFFSYAIEDDDERLPAAKKHAG